MSLSADRCVQHGGRRAYIVKADNSGMMIVDTGTAACNNYCDIIIL